MEKLEFKGYMLKGSKVGITAEYTEPLNELVEASISSCLRQQMLEYILRFKGPKSNSKVREYRVNRNVFENAIRYLDNNASSTIYV